MRQRKIVRARYDATTRALVVFRHFDVDLEDGAVVGVEIIHERSVESHAHFFASLKDAWLNIPEGKAHLFPSPEHLRAFALIREGYCTVNKVVCDTESAAQSLARWAGRSDPLTIATVEGKVVTLAHAESMSYAAMGKAKFQKAKDAVLDYAWSLAGVDPATARANAAKSA